MDVFEKIEQIRKKPEHIRRRYVLVCVAISMIFIIGIWALSLKGSFNSSEKIIDDETRLQMMKEVENLKDLKNDISSIRTEQKKEESAEEEEEGYEFFNLDQ